MEMTGVSVWDCGLLVVPSAGGDRRALRGAGPAQPQTADHVDRTGVSDSHGRYGGVHHGERAAAALSDGQRHPVRVH